MRIAVAFAAFLLMVAPAAAETYPARAIKFLVPFPAGGATDILARLIGQRLADLYGKPVVVENRPGGGGGVGSDAVAKSPPDGYTITMGTVGTHAINASLYPKLPYDPVADFEPVALVATLPNIMVIHPSIPARSVAEFIALAKASPGKFNFASSGNGTSIHLSGELFKTMAKVDIVHVPYRGSGPAITDLLAGRDVQLMFDNLPPTLPHVKSGGLRALAVTSATRAAALPDIPTLAEAGLPGFEASSWFGVLAPAKTPADIVAKLNADINAAMMAPEMQQRFADVGAEPRPGPPEAFRAHIKAEIAKWAEVVKVSGAKVD